MNSQIKDVPEQAGEADQSLTGLIPLRWGRVMGTALPLIVLNSGWIAHSEMKTGVTELTISTLFIGVTFMLFVLTLLNLLVRRLAGPRAAMNQPELMALYTLLSLSSAVAGVGHLGFFLPFLTNPFYYDAPGNGWHTFWHLLPSWIGPRDPAILKGFYEGHSTAFRMDVLSAWAPPLLLWGLFFLVLLWTTLCLAAILHHRWANEEHLPFPVLALPLEMTREGAPLYRSTLLWLGFAIPAFVHSLNSLHSLYPTLPTLQINSVHDLVFDAPLLFPWNATGSLFYQLHPSGVGFGYLVNTDVSFSLWFFYLVKKAAGVWAASVNLRSPATGWFVDENGQFPYINFQGWGAWLTLGLAALWTGRISFGAYLRRALRGERGQGERGQGERSQSERGQANEPMSARVAVLGFVLGFCALCACVWSWGGSWWLPVAFLGIWLLMMVTLARIRAEMAVVSTELVWISPQSILPAVLGTSHLAHTDLAHMATLSWFNLDYRAAAMPHEMDGIVGLERARARLSPLVPAMLITAAVAIVTALLWDLQLYYVNGAATGNVNSWRISKGSEAWTHLQNWLQDPQPPDPHALGGLAFGAGMTLLLTALRTRFLGFPLHPAAYALNMSFANDLFWGDMFVAWLIKALVLRYGGMALYRKGLPFFLGLILGDFVTGSAWSIIGTLFHLDLFRTFAT